MIYKHVLCLWTYCKLGNCILKQLWLWGIYLMSYSLEFEHCKWTLSTELSDAPSSHPPGDSECDLIGKQGLCRCDVELRSCWLGWTVIQLLVPWSEGHVDRHPGKKVRWGCRQRLEGGVDGFFPRAPVRCEASWTMVEHISAVSGQFLLGCYGSPRSLSDECSLVHKHLPMKTCSARKEGCPTLQPTPARPTMHPLKWTLSEALVVKLIFLLEEKTQLFCEKLNVEPSHCRKRKCLCICS